VAELEEKLTAAKRKYTDKASQFVEQVGRRE
jgi:hypothetical protein